MYLKESTHAHNSHSMINDQISIAMETKEHLLTQRQSFKRLQTRFNDLSNRFPVISRLVCLIFQLSTADAFLRTGERGAEVKIFTEKGVKRHDINVGCGLRL